MAKIFVQEPGVKDIVGSFGSRLVSGSYRETKVSVVMEMA
jgi:hypothetical protein